MAPRLRLLSVLFVPLILAGCAQVAGPVGEAEAGHAGASCQDGKVVTGFDAAGGPVCARVSSFARGFACPTGQFVNGFDSTGTPTCGALVTTVKPDYVPETYASSLKVVGIYGVRNTTSSDLWDLKIMVELPAGSAPMDVAQTILRYSNGIDTRNYAHGAGPEGDGAPPADTFRADWIRGAGSAGLIQPGDLVQLHLNLVSHELAERADVNLDIIPESGSPTPASFRTPPTYSTATTITLR